MTNYNINIKPIPALKDNYIWAIINKKTESVVIVDPSLADPVNVFLAQHHLKLAAILITHHHWDHTGGVSELKKTFSIPVYGPPTISDVTDPIDDGNEINLKDIHLKLKVMAIPGHTLDHLAYYNDDLIFCGDTLFSAGCGKVFEGTYEQMFDSLQKIAALSDHTLIYCGHEYTLSNLLFAKKVTPNNVFIQKYGEKIEKIRDDFQETLPSMLSIEKKINPFLRCNDTEIITSLKKNNRLLDDAPASIFKALRMWKDEKI